MVVFVVLPALAPMFPHFFFLFFGALSVLLIRVDPYSVAGSIGGRMMKKTSRSFYHSTHVVLFSGEAPLCSFYNEAEQNKVMKPKPRHLLIHRNPDPFSNSSIPTSPLITSCCFFDLSISKLSSCCRLPAPFTPHDVR